MTTRVLNFVRERIGEPDNGITMNSLIEEDFGIAGLDTISFFEEFFKEFEVTNSKEFPLDDYVSSENLFGDKTPRKNLSIQQLIIIAEAKKWDEKLINQ